MTVARRPLMRRVAIHLGLLPFLIFALFPFYHMTLTSLKQDRELYDRFAIPLIITQGPTLEHYSKLLWDTEFLIWTKNSLMVTILATAISVVIGTIAAYALARMRFFGVGAFGTWIFVTYLVPTSLLFLPIAIPGLVCAILFAFTLSWNEFIYALTFTSSSDQITASVGVTSELIRGDIYYWGELMAGAILGSVPIVILYVFFLDYYVSGLTAGAIK